MTIFPFYEVKSFEEGFVVRFTLYPSELGPSVNSANDDDPYVVHVGIRYLNLKWVDWESPDSNDGFMSMIEARSLWSRHIDQGYTRISDSILDRSPAV